MTLLGHYWRADDPVELTAAIGRDWADVLEGLPQEYIQMACIQYMRQEDRRKPAPGAIYAIARRLMPAPVVAGPVYRKTTPEEDAAYMATVGRGNINPEKAAAAERIMKEATRKFGGAE